MFASQGIKAVYSGKISRLCTSGLFRRNLSAAKITFPAVRCTRMIRFVIGHTASCCFVCVPEVLHDNSLRQAGIVSYSDIS